ncbi:hypothetical protein E2C01_022828 [Portunus trituberculatus]|uniref:Uncharacterized protein n=1 Tax=Portunus trituberculatus TaxID=210409 RepID=A0A5B7E728_PORTR|nr:hypothetical protein [Portunus trituberculatus]
MFRTDVGKLQPVGHKHHQRNSCGPRNPNKDSVERGLTEPTDVACDCCVVGVGAAEVGWVGTTVVPATVVPGVTATVVGAVMVGTACVAMEVVVVLEEVSATVFCWVVNDAR